MHTHTVDYKNTVQSTGSPLLLKQVMAQSPLCPLTAVEGYLEVVVLEEGARHHLELKVGLSWAHKHTQLIAVVAGGNGEVGTQVAVAFHVLQAKEEPTNWSYWMI